MDSTERATVMLLHGSSEDRLRQVITQGLVSKDVQQDIEDTLAQVEDSKIHVETLTRQIEKYKSEIQALQADIAVAKRRAREDADYYGKAVAAYKREEKRTRDHAERREAFGMATLGAVAFVVANVLGRLVFGGLIK